MRRITPSPTQSLPLSVILSLTVYRQLLALCPSELRRGYASEMLQVFKQCCRDSYAEQGVSGVARVWLPTLGDLMTGVAAEYVAVLALAWKENWLMHRVRTSVITIFCAYIAFILAGLGFQKLTEYDDFMASARTHTMIGLAYNVVVIGAVVALLAVLAGGLPLAVAAVRYALAKGRRDILLLMSVPVLVVLLLAAFLIVGGRLIGPSSTPRSMSDAVSFFGLLVVLVGGAIVSAGAVSLAIARSEIAPALYRFSRVPALVATVAMVAMLAATVVWGLSLRAAVPQLFYSNEGIRASSTAGTWGVIVALMVVATLAALVGAARSLSPRQFASA